MLRFLVPMIVGLVVVLLGMVIASAVSARILQWRAKRMHFLLLTYNAAFILSFKAAMVAGCVSCLVVLAAAFLGIDLPVFVSIAAFLLGLPVWLSVHTKALLKIVNRSVIRTKHARALSVNVFLWMLGGTMLVCIVVGAVYNKVVVTLVSQ